VGEGIRKEERQQRKWVENRKKILNSGNEPKNVLTVKELVLSRAQNELFFRCKKPQSKRKREQKCTIRRLNARVALAAFDLTRAQDCIAKGLSAMEQFEYVDENKGDRHWTGSQGK
jgi:hypothetical protein